MIGSTAAAVPPGDDGHSRWNDEFIRLVQANAPRIKQFLERVHAGADAGLVEDALQDALIVAFDKWDVVSTHENPLGWVYKTAYFKLRRMVDERSREDVGLGTCEPPSSTDPANEWESEAMLRWLLSQLPTRQRAVLAMAADGFEDDEISETLGIAISSIRNYRTVARRKLADHMDLRRRL